MYIDSVPAHNVSYKAQMKVNSQPVTMEVDTGLTLALISKRMWRRMGSPYLCTSDSIFRSYDGHRMKLLGTFDGDLPYGDVKVLAKATVVHGFKDYGLLERDNIEIFFLLKTQGDED